MTGGFDVAVGAAGLISLGITACQGILRYYNTYRNFLRDIAGACEAIRLLERTLRDIQNKIQSPNLSQSHKDRITSCVTACSGSINELQLTLIKIQNGPPLIKRMVYPFREKTMEIGLRRMSDLQSSLVASFVGLNMCVILREDFVVAYSSSDILDTASATMNAINTMIEDYSDGLSELSGTLTTLTSVANEKKLCRKTSREFKISFEDMVVKLGVIDRTFSFPLIQRKAKECYETIKVFILERECAASAGQRNHSAEVLNLPEATSWTILTLVQVSVLENLFNCEFSGISSVERHNLPGLDRFNPRSITLMIQNWLRSFLFHNDARNTLLLIYYSGYHNTFPALGAGSTRYLSFRSRLAIIY